MWDFGMQLMDCRPVQGSLPNTVALMDPTLCGIILSAALDNALQHGHPQAGPALPPALQMGPYGDLEIPSN